MALKLEDLINKKKEPGGIILDLAKVKIRSKEEFELHFEQIPEFKIRPEKVRYEDYKMRDTDFKFAQKKRDTKRMLKKTELLENPVPVSMRSVRLEDLAAVDIQWKMLTMARPLNKLEEEIFNRLVELGNLRVQTKQHEEKLFNAATAAAPPGSQSLAILGHMGIVVSKNKRGVTETRCRSCKECFEELCTGDLCKQFPYDLYTRVPMEREEYDGQDDNDDDEEDNNKNKKGGRKKGGHSSRRPSKKIGSKSKSSNTHKPGGRGGKGKSKSPQKYQQPSQRLMKQTHHISNKPLTEKINKLKKKKGRKKKKSRSISTRRKTGEEKQVKVMKVLTENN